ncbi:MAG: 2-hydroxychromene-2-carboxylate isomerase [Alphaproteobacteria bacterium MarineAlpha5_Bin9]|nr:MAG: 2-hydroxychromene-2-carboxylate isomerase [Alphaproteobacteria bacterium MarineAlpha5_Bin9]|tara:strand:+ start:7850 stop:8443 length:594 start_codon:yes stop_codon:yes gene_type:complete
MINIEFWFSIGSTYTYLSVERILNIERDHNVKFIWNPFSVRQIMIEMENIPFTPPLKKNKSDYMWRDIERRAQFYGFNAKVPAPYPLKDFDLANKIAVLGMEEEWGIEYVRKTYSKWFTEGKEPAMEPNLSETLSELNLNTEEIINLANTKKNSEKYYSQTEAAKSKKIFGSPTFIYEGEVFWGDDRLEDCIKWVKK